MKTYEVKIKLLVEVIVTLEAISEKDARNAINDGDYNSSQCRESDSMIDEILSVKELHGDGKAEVLSTVKMLPLAVIKEIDQQNKARRMMGLSPIDVKTRACLDCSALFQSAGRRICGCKRADSTNA